MQRHGGIIAHLFVKQKSHLPCALLLHRTCFLCFFALELSRLATGLSTAPAVRQGVGMLLGQVP